MLCRINLSRARVGLALGVVAKTTYNNAFKFALAVLGQAYEDAKAHSFTGASTSRGIPYGPGSGKSATRNVVRRVAP